MHLIGACLCRAVGYEILVNGTEVADYCHCRECRRWGGAPVQAWVQVAPLNFRVTRGAAKGYASSARATRWFCPDCGSPLYMTDSADISVGVTLGTLDQPDQVRPNVHGWVCERIGWFDISDALPRYAQAPPYDV